MSNKKPRKLRGSRNQTGAKPDEVFTVGPIQVVRKGRLVEIASDWTPSAFNAMRASLPEERERLRKRIKDNLSELIELIKRCDPLPFIFTLFIKNCLVDPETFSEPEHNGLEARVEYAHSLVTAVADHGSRAPTENEHSRFEELIEKIINDCRSYFLIRQSQADSPLEIEETKFWGMMRHLFIRGSSIEEHDTDLTKSLFTPHDEFFLRKGLFTTTDFLHFCDSIRRSMNEAVDEHVQTWRGIKTSHEEFRSLLDARPDASIEDVIAMIRSSDAGKQAAALMEALQQKELYFEFLVPTTSASRTLCDYLSLSPGDNREFLDFEKSPGWPSNNSRTYTKPLISRGGRYYCPNPVTLMRNRAAILEAVIRDTDPVYYRKQYAKVRGRIIEDLAIQYFRVLFPSAQFFQNLYYRAIENGETRRFETDGLVILDDRLFILEMKSGPFSTAAMRGAEQALKADLDHLIAEPYQQALRTLRFIEGNAPARFEMADGSHLVTISRPEQFRATYLVNVTLSDIGHISARLNSARAMGLVGKGKWPWSVFVNDLRVIAEILTAPSEFLLYLERRLALNDLPAVSAIDELDYLGMFLQDGLYFKPDEPLDVSRFLPIGYTVPIIRYYDHLAGRVTSGEKPRLNVSEWYRSLVSKIEATGKTGAYYVGTTLLSINGEEQRQIENWFRKYSTIAESDSLPHNLTLLGKDITPLIFWVTSGLNSAPVRNAERHAELKRFQTNSNRTILVILEGTEMSNVDFKILEGPFRDPEALHMQMTDYRRAQYKRHVALHGKPGRNDPCPCNSGRKFKKCCLEETISCNKGG